MRQGADVDALEALGREMAGVADTLEDALGRLSSMLARTGWEGPDAEAFRRAWNGPVRSELLQSATGIREAGAEVRRQADDQRRVSDGTGGALGGDRAPWSAPPPGTAVGSAAVVPGDAAATVAVARSLGAGVALGLRPPAADVGADVVLDGAVLALVPGGDVGGLLAGQPPGRWALTAPEHPGALVAGVVATQPWDEPPGLTGWDATSTPGAAPDVVPSGTSSPAGTGGGDGPVVPAWQVLDRSSGEVGDLARVVAPLW